MTQTDISQNVANSDVKAAPGVVTSTTGVPIIDLGILVDCGLQCAYGVSNSGKIVGIYYPQNPNAMLWSRQYGVMNLGALGDPQFSVAYDINDLGQVTGSSWEPGTTLQRAFFWTGKGGMVNLGTSVDPLLDPNSFSMGFGINNRSEIVGIADNFACLWTDENGIVLLGSLWDYCAAWDINDYGQIVGLSQIYPPEVYHATRWTDVGEILDLGTVKLQSEALGINNHGEIVGGSSDYLTYPHQRIGSDYNSNAMLCFDNSCVAFIWTEQKGMTQLPMLAGDAGSAHAINDIGHIVGWSLTAAFKAHAVVWTSENSIKDLGTLPGDVESVAYGINNLGQIVGCSLTEDGNEHAVIWTLK